MVTENILFLVLIDGRNFYDQPINLIIQLENMMNLERSRLEKERIMELDVY